MGILVAPSLPLSKGAAINLLRLSFDLMRESGHKSAGSIRASLAVGPKWTQLFSATRQAQTAEGFFWLESQSLSCVMMWMSTSGDSRRKRCVGER